MFFLLHAFTSFLLSIILMMQPAPDQSADRSILIKGYDDMSYSVTEIKAEPEEELKIIMQTVSEQDPSQMAHNFVLLEQDVDALEFSDKCADHPENDYIAPDLEYKIIAKTEMVPGGEKAAVVFEAPEEPGEYVYVCTFPNHYISGMEGILIVKE